MVLLDLCCICCLTADSQTLLEKVEHFFFNYFEEDGLKYKNASLYVFITPSLLFTHYINSHDIHAYMDCMAMYIYIGLGIDSLSTNLQQLSVIGMQTEAH